MKIKGLTAIILLLVVPATLRAQSQISLKASCEQYFNSTADEYDFVPAPSEDGIYPVRLTVTTKTPEKTLYVKIYRAEKQTGPFSLVIDTMQGNEEFFDLYDTSPAKPGQKYYYIAVLGRYEIDNAPAQNKSSVVCGWGALTHEAFYVYFNNQLIKSYKKMTLMNKPNALSKLGNEQAQGSHCGDFLYEAKVKGMGGLATMTYKNYSDDGICFFDGDMITKADMTASGTMDGTIKISGMYNGTVSYSDIKVKNSNAAGGTYKIKPAGTQAKNIDYSWNFVNY